MYINGNHHSYMARCLYLAKLGSSFTAPNPMVGAVIVYNGEIIGEGFHKRYGEPHAEPNAINSVKDKSLLKKSTLYVNLEPCSHYGKTPPCASLIVRMGIPHVVIATLDPNPKVSGRGVEILRQAGINVEVGVLEEEARYLNRRFFYFQEKKRPYITLKWAQTADGFIDICRKNNSTSAMKISNSVTQQFTHKMRSENMAMMVGTQTVMLDNPSLTLRDWFGRSPVRVTIDRKGIIPDNFNIKDESEPTVIFTEKEIVGKPNLEYIQISSDKNNLNEILQHLYEKNIHSVLVEGGEKLLNSFIEADLWDEANIEISKVIIGKGIKAPVLKNAEIETEKIVENHQWIHYRIRK
ncbi:Riboflavin biosynthesis protein RibD (Includes: Diaminohydroxyphosphoribosylaminopyrimidine deaminase; 5-amino-6-(5-phosphoribosylamino)uracil reductase) [uncultured Paludibacter sp.]|nr:Riboflavin biosynthesis protein RibD (Includes: Diaminohydroxyphosphoribosylaminopyrimidine deaminase; 5-amino-6-(5-phosphoribosylamino)uracil reductase) [uncultured Paludibacter sp.]